MGKASVMEIVSNHYATYVDGRTGSPRVRDYVLPIAIPLVLGLIAPVLGFRLRDASGAIAAFAILTGLLFALVIFVFQLRQGVSHDPRTSSSSKLKDRIDQLFSNVLYAILVGLLATVAAVIADAFAIQDGPDYSLTGWGTGIVIGTGLHVVAVALMCLKRISGAYKALTR